MLTDGMPIGVPEGVDQDRRWVVGPQLRIGTRPDDYPLPYWDGNRFAFLPTGENAVGITQATFTANAAGTRAKSVTLEYYNAEGLGTFTRA